MPTTVKNVSINHTENLQQSQLTTAADTVNMAVSTLIAAHARVRDRKIDYSFKKNSEFFLKTGPQGPSEAECWALMVIFTNTLNGLAANRKINVKTMQGAYGSVAYTRIDPSQAGQKRKDGFTVARHSEHNNLIARSDINIATSTLDKGVIVRVQTMIHEASHRYANTRDYGNRGYTNEAGTRFFEEGLTRQEAITNADSIAWMAVKIAEPFCQWLNPVQYALNNGIAARRKAMGYDD